MWTGFSVLSLYAYGKRVFNRKQNKVEPKVEQKVPIKVLVQHQIYHSFPHQLNHKKYLAIKNLKNDKTYSLKKIRKLIKKIIC